MYECVYTYVLLKLISKKRNDQTYITAVSEIKEPTTTTTSQMTTTAKSTKMVLMNNFVAKLAYDALGTNSSKNYVEAPSDASYSFDSIEIHFVRRYDFSLYSETIVPDFIKENCGDMDLECIYSEFSLKNNKEEFLTERLISIKGELGCYTLLENYANRNSGNGSIEKIETYIFTSSKAVYESGVQKNIIPPYCGIKLEIKGTNTYISFSDNQESIPEEDSFKDEAMALSITNSLNESIEYFIGTK